MKKFLSIQWVALAALWLSLLAGASAETVQPRTYCRFVSERLDDFAWENDRIDGDGLGTGVVIDPARILGFQLSKSGKELESHALLITETDAVGQLDYFSGYGWERAGEINPSSDWNAYLEYFSRQSLK